MIIIGFKKAAEALHHEAGEALRDRMLAEFHKITSPIITREEYGKPAVKEKIPVSVSHSGDIVICAMGAERRADLPMLRSGEEIAEGFFLADASPCSEIGADIEKISDKRSPERTEAIAGRYFSCEEQALIRSSDDPVGCFYALWTRKESYIKLTGRGLSALRAADTLCIPESAAHISFTLLSNGEKYSLSVSFTE